MKTFITYYDSPGGTLKITADDDCVTSILFWEGETNDVTKLNSVLKNCLQQLDEYFSGKRTSFDFPMQQGGTEFQQKVWQLLLQIPFGKTLSYLDLSKQYGDVKAIRAVASANGKNNLAIVVPCHRVIGSNASLTGYAGGLWRKQWLLEHERKHYSGVEQSTLF
ncbi:MAG: cysteine methyltransferase [Chitinophagaceae bacterium]